jgi:hypothetical protein
MADPLTTIITFLGGGVIGAGIHYASTARSHRQIRHSSYIHEQLDRLYGPLYFFTNQNEELLKLSRTILEKHAEYFDGSQWSPEPQTQATLRNESLRTIELSNAYADQVVENNGEILSLLRENYAYADQEDIELFTQFAIDAIRMNKEVKEKRLESIPLNIYKEVGSISFSRPDFLARVKGQFEDKQKILRKYH